MLLFATGGGTRVDRWLLGVGSHSRSGNQDEAWLGSKVEASRELSAVSREASVKVYRNRSLGSPSPLESPIGILIVRVAGCRHSSPSDSGTFCARSP
jgi:hypothetical protein